MPERAVASLSALGVAVALAACSTSYDAGDTPEAQLCDVLEAALEAHDEPGGLQLEPLLEAGAGDPADLPAELRPIQFAYRANEGAYDQLGTFRPAITFTAHLVELSTGDLLGSSTLTPTVLDSALAVDDALRSGACEP